MSGLSYRGKAGGRLCPVRECASKIDKREKRNRDKTPQGLRGAKCFKSFIRRNPRRSGIFGHAPSPPPPSSASISLRRRLSAATVARILRLMALRDRNLALNRDRIACKDSSSRTISRCFFMTFNCISSGTFECRSSVRHSEILRLQSSYVFGSCSP